MFLFFHTKTVFFLQTSNLKYRLIPVNQSLIKLKKTNILIVSFLKHTLIYPLQNYKLPQKFCPIPFRQSEKTEMMLGIKIQDLSRRLILTKPASLYLLFQNRQSKQNKADIAFFSN